VQTTPTTREDHGALSHGFSRAFELALTPAIFGVLGWVLDRVFGTGPLLVIAFSVFGIVGMGVRTWYSYDHEMRQLEQQRLAARSSRERTARRVESLSEDPMTDMSAVREPLGSEPRR
jgi:F0F1-type ATP synthase assembly protein I